MLTYYRNTSPQHLFGGWGILRKACQNRNSRKRGRYNQGNWCYRELESCCWTAYPTRLDHLHNQKIGNKHSHHVDSLHLTLALCLMCIMARTHTVISHSLAGSVDCSPVPFRELVKAIVAESLPGAIVAHFNETSYCIVFCAIAIVYGGNGSIKQPWISIRTLWKQKDENRKGCELNVNLC